MNIAVSYQDESCQARAEQLGRQLALPVVALEQDDAELLLVVTTDHLELCATEKNAPGAIYVDFLSGKLAYRTRQKSQSEMLAKALGIKADYKPTIIDATAGLGGDAYIMAMIGCEVTMLECSPIVAALLEDGLLRAQQSPEFKKLKLNLYCVDASDYLLQLAEKPDVIYLDPMFPERKKTAKVKKNMQLLQRLLGEEDDGSELLMLALKNAKKRVIVKRPRLADFLNNQKPDWQIVGKSSRFDVYATHTDDIAFSSS